MKSSQRDLFEIKSIKTVMLNYLEVMKLNYKNMVHYFCICIILTEK
jgi:hypothetical protein